MVQGIRAVIGESSAFPEGQLVARVAAGHSLIAVRRAGRVLVFLDQCTHQPIPLSDFGELKEGLLICHAHGGVFDLDLGGKAVRNPPCEALKAVACSEEAGLVYVSF
jgi:nitrite reductase/ring-hydroxylating ferredoxin subunit